MSLKAKVSYSLAELDYDGHCGRCGREYRTGKQAFVPAWEDWPPIAHLAIIRDPKTGKRALAAVETDAFPNRKTAYSKLIVDGVGELSGDDAMQLMVARAEVALKTVEVLVQEAKET